MQQPIFSDPVYKYLKFKKRLEQAVKSGRFARYTRKKRHMLLKRLRRLKRQIEQLGLQWKLGAAMALGSVMIVSENAEAQQYVPREDEFIVNTYTTSAQYNCSLDSDADGDFVVVWESYGQDGGSWGIFGQLHDKSGSKVGSEFQVNTYTTEIQFAPDVAMNASGEFVAVWSSSLQDGDGSGIYGQRYDNMGVALGDEIHINTYTTNQQRYPEVALNDDGSFVVVWQDYEQDGNGGGIYAQRFDESGNKDGNEFLVNTYTTHWQTDPVIAADSEGNFVVAWEDQQRDGNYNGIFAQRFLKSGVKDGDAFQVNTHTTFGQRYPTIDVNGDGDFVVAWQSYLQDGSYYSIHAQKFDGSGNPIGSEIPVNAYTTERQQNASVAIDASGKFVVVWESVEQDGSISGSYGHIFDENGNTIIDEFIINTYTTSAQNTPKVAMESNGNFIVTWNSSGQDGDSYGVYAKRYFNVGNTGDEFRVNDYTTGNQGGGVISQDKNGNFVIVWTSPNQDGDNYGIFAQRYDESGSEIGGEFQVNTYTTGEQAAPDVDMNANGAMVVSWASFNQDGSSDGIYAQIYDNNGDPVGGEFQVNTYTTGRQYRPQVAIDDEGDFVIGWVDSAQDGDYYGIYAQRFDPTGTKVGTEFRANTTTENYQDIPSLDIDADGDFIISWTSRDQDGDTYGLYAQRYDKDGSTVGSEFLINTNTTGNQRWHSVSMDDTGEFVIGWGDSALDGNYYGVFAKRYDKDGVAYEDEFQVNTHTTDMQFPAHVAKYEEGFVIVWDSTNGQDGDASGVYAQRYDNDGNEIGVEFKVNTYTTSSQNVTGVTISDDGDFVVTWRSYGQDGGGLGIYAQRFEFDGPPILETIEDITEDENVEVSFTASHFNDEGQTITYSLDATSLGLGMTIDSSTGAFSWTPNEDEDGSYNVTIIASDGAFSDEETVNIIVNEVNQAPILTAIGAQSGDELTTIAFSVSSMDSDLPANTLNYSLDATSLGLGMAIGGSTGDFSWTPGEDEDGSYDVTVTVSDGTLTDEETITLTVNEVNEAPVLDAIGSQSGDETTEITFTASSSDADLPANTLTYSLDATSLGLGMTIDGSSGNFSWTPGEDEDGGYNVTVTVSDGTTTDQETIILVVNEVNEAPVLSAIGAQSGDELTTISFTATSTDVDLPANTLTYGIDATSLGLGMTIDGTAGDFSWTPGEDEDGSYDVTIIVSDGTLTDEETITLTVNEVNEAPILDAIGAQSGDEMTEITFTASSSDADLPANTLTYSLDATSLGLGMTIDGSSGDFSWTPAEDEDGGYNVTVTVSDGTATDQETIILVVNEVNEAPVLSAIGAQSGDETTEITFTASSSDADLPANTLTYSLDATSLGLGMTIDGSTGAFSWTPGEDEDGSYDVTVTVSDGTLTDVETIALTVNEVNVAPVLDAIGAQSGDEDTEIIFTASSSDIDLPANILTYNLDAASLGLGMTIGSSTGAFSWTPGEDEDGTYDVTVSVSDGTLTDEETITLTVNEVNEAPVLSSIGDQQGDVGTNINFTASAMDADIPANTLTFTIDAGSQALGMAIDGSTGQFSWMPAAAQVGDHPVTVSVSDGQLTDSETLMITVSSTAPVLDAIADQELNNDEELVLNLTASGGSGSLSYSLDVTSLDKGMTVNATSGEFRWVPRVWHFGQHDVTVTVSDGTNQDSQTFSIIVNILLDVKESGNGVTVFPNPAAQKINIELISSENYSEYRILDVSGRQQLSGSVPYNSFEIDISKLTKGIYILELKGEEISYVQQIIKD